MNKALTIATLTMAMTAAPLTAHAETVDEANQATQTAYQAYQQAETEKIKRGTIVMVISIAMHGRLPMLNLGHYIAHTWMQDNTLD